MNGSVELSDDVFVLLFHRVDFEAERVYLGLERKREIWLGLRFEEKEMFSGCSPGECRSRSATVAARGCSCSRFASVLCCTQR